MGVSPVAAIVWPSRFPLFAVVPKSSVSPSSCVLVACAAPRRWQRAAAEGLDLRGSHPLCPKTFSAPRRKQEQPVKNEAERCCCQTYGVLSRAACLAISTSTPERCRFSRPYGPPLTSCALSCKVRQSMDATASLPALSTMTASRSDLIQK